MRVLLLFLLVVLTFGSACHSDYRIITLRLDDTIYNNNFSADFHLAGTELSSNQTLVAGKQGVQPVGVRSVDVDTPDGRFRLSLIDMDQDHQYNEVGTDAVMLSPFGQDSVPINMGMANIGTLRSKTIVQVDRSFYLLSDLTNAGDLMQLVPWDSCPRKAITARLQTRMKQLPVHDSKGNDAYLTLRNDEGKSTLLLVWNYQDRSREVLSALQQNKTAWEQEWQIIGVNMNDASQKMQAFQEEYPLDFENYLMTAKTCHVLNCHALPPYALVLSADGTIRQQGMKWMGIKEWLWEEVRVEL